MQNSVACSDSPVRSCSVQESVLKASGALDVAPGGQLPEVLAPLGALLRQFLACLVDYRGCSPRTVAAYEADCLRFVRFREHEGLSLDASCVKTLEVRLHLAALHLAPNSIRRALYALASFFGYLVDIEVILRNPVVGIQAPKLRRSLPRVLTTEQCQQLLSACETSTEQLVIGVLLLAGLRRGEALSLDVGDIGVDVKELRTCGKGRRERVVPVSPALGSIIGRYLSERHSDDPALVVNQTGRRMGLSSFSRLFKRVLTRAGIADCGFSPHSLRHNFASHLVRAGVDIVTVRDLLGHSSIATTSIYLHSTPGTTKHAVELLPFHSSGSTP